MSAGPALSGSPGELPCENEQIHIPGAIQPHGALLAVLADSRRVTHSSENLAAVLGVSATDVLGRSLEQALGAPACDILLSRALDEDVGAHTACRIAGPQGKPLQLQAHRSGRHICIDIEPVGPEAERGPPVSLIGSLLRTFEQATEQEELCRRAVDGLRAMTGYDRVMAYRFAKDGHGEVIAEALAPGLQPYLGLRYPGFDIPAQARRQYLRQRVGAISDSCYRPVPLLTDKVLDDGSPLDLTHSALRSVSPVHRQYMRNMKTGASLTIGLAQRGELWGMLVCHHATPRAAWPELRAVADTVGHVVSLLLESLGKSSAYARQVERYSTLSSLIERLAAPVSLPEVIGAAADELLNLVNATGGIARVSGTFLRFGTIPPQQAAEHALTTLLAEANGKAVAFDDLGLRYRALDACTCDGSGALLLPLGLDGDSAILWFRPELPQTIAWGGNPAEHTTSDPATGRLSPRSSFAAWKETVRGRSAPWTEVDLAMAERVREAVNAAASERTRQELARLRHYDPLTGLPNRSLLQEQLVETERVPASAALLFLDLDRFKLVNDTMGHAAGDALLVEVARRLVAIAGPGNLTARLGGDEFVVLCLGMDAEALTALADRLRAAIEAPFEISGQSCYISVSIGIAAAGTAGEIDLVRAADLAMYAAKQGGGNRGVSFSSSLLDRASRTFELEQDLRAAQSDGDQFALLYQPLFGAAQGARHLAGFEALIRWRHPRHGWLSPAEFIPLAEKSGLILPLGHWVLVNALRQARAFQQIGLNEDLRMAVNVSASELRDPGFCARLVRAVEVAGLRPASVSLEVTETVMTDAASLAVLHEVRGLGVRVAIDDFGVGYSSLSCIRRLPADLVKLDRSFVEDVTGGNDESFVKAVVALARVAGKPVVFEGIETQAQFDLAVAAGASMIQGFFLAPPLSSNAAEELVARQAQISAVQTDGFRCKLQERCLGVER